MAATKDPLRHYDILHGYNVTQVLPDGTYDSTAFDLQGRPGSAVALVQVASPSAGTTTPKLQESDDGATGWTDVPDSEVRNLTFPASSGFEPTVSPGTSVQRVRFQIGLRKRWVRFRVSHASGGIGLTVFSAELIVGRMSVPPTIPVGVF